ncbi:MAG: DUF3037 domain-containing protein [Xanthomonadales bacterium]|nr:DUF3037 domain-containing protein [Xanthomonadales bacterium]
MHSYDYAIVRVVPRVERGEFVNAGVLLSCRDGHYLGAAFALDEARLRALDAQVDINLVRCQLSGIERIIAGAADAGEIARLPARARFHWLTAQRSALIQTSPVHGGRCADPARALAHLLERMVQAPA